MPKTNTRENATSPLATVRLETGDPAKPIIRHTPTQPINDPIFGLVVCAEGLCLIEAKRLVAQGGVLPGQSGRINDMYVFHRRGEISCTDCQEDLKIASGMFGPFRVWYGHMNIEGDISDLLYLDVVNGSVYGPFKTS